MKRKKAITVAKKKKGIARRGASFSFPFFLYFSYFLFFAGEVWFCFVFWFCGKRCAGGVRGKGRGVGQFGRNICTLTRLSARTHGNTVVNYLSLSLCLSNW